MVRSERNSFPKSRVEEHRCGDENALLINGVINLQMESQIEQVKTNIGSRRTTIRRQMPGVPAQGDRHSGTKSIALLLNLNTISW